MQSKGSQAVFATATCDQYPNPLELDPVSEPATAPTIEASLLFVDGRGRGNYTTQIPPEPVHPKIQEMGLMRHPGPKEWIIATDTDGNHLGIQPRTEAIQNWTLVDWLCYVVDAWGVVDVCDPDKWPSDLLADLDSGGRWS